MLFTGLALALGDALPQLWLEINLLCSTLPMVSEAVQTL